MRIDNRPFYSVHYLQPASLTAGHVNGAARAPITKDTAYLDLSSDPLRHDAAARSAQDALALIRSADSSLAEIESLITRMRALTLYAASDTSTYEDRLAVQRELDGYADDVSRIATTTKFNGRSLLDGTAAAVWSSDRLTTRALINGAIRRAGGSSAQGNYRITVDLIAPGVAETQQAGAFRIRIPAGGTEGPGGPGVDPGLQPGEIAAYNMPVGDFTLNVFESADVGIVFGTLPRVRAIHSSGAYWMTDADGYDSGDVTEYFGADNRYIFRAGYIDSLAHDGFNMNVSLYFRVEDIDIDNNTVTFDVQAHGLDEWGKTVDYEGMKLVATTNGFTDRTELDKIGLVVGNGEFALGAGGAARFSIGDAYTVSVAAPGKENTGILIKGDLDMSHPDSWNYPEFWLNANSRLLGAIFAIREEAAQSSLVHFRSFYLNSDTGQVYDGDLVVQFGSHMREHGIPIIPIMEMWGMMIPLEEYKHLQIATTRSENIPEPEPTPDIDEGTFDDIVLTDDTLLTVSFGSGEQTQIRIYKSDTVGEIARKLDDAVRLLLESKGYDPEGFGQRFVEFIRDHRYDEVELEDGSKVLYGYFSFSTPLPGADGRIIVAGPDEFMHNFDLTVLRAAEESRFELSVRDAHTGATHASGVQITGNTAIGLLHDNVDVRFDPLADTIVTWNDDTESFVLNKADGKYTTIVHLADRMTAFAVGDPSGLDMKYNIGDVTAESLGVRGLIVTTRMEAARTLSKLDAALAKVAMLRARLEAADSRMSSAATLAMSGVPARGERLDSSGAELMLQLMRHSIIARADTAVPAAANQKHARIAALAALSSTKAA